MLKKITILTAAALMLCGSLWAQATLSAQQMIGITPMLPRSMDIPEDARRSLGNKLNQISTQNGFGSGTGEFVLTANVVTLDKQATHTAPPQFVVDYEITLFILNMLEEVIIDQVTFNVQGIDRLENKAMIQAVNMLKPRNPEIRRFMEGSRESIIEYYNTRIPTLLTKAQSLADRNEYREALAVLAAVPEAVDQYPLVADKMTEYYIKEIDRQADMYLAEAKAAMTLKYYELALDYLVMIDPSSTRAPEAAAMMKKIKSSLDAKEQQEMEEKMRLYEAEQEAAQRQHDDQMMLAKMQIEAAQKVGVEQAKNKNTTSNDNTINKWYSDRFKK